MATTREHEQEIARLQRRLGDLLARLDLIDAASQDYDRTADDVITAAQELIEYEDRVPQLLDERPRRLTVFALRGCGAGTMALAAAIALGVVPGGRPWWWLPIAVILAVAGARLLTTRVLRARASHVRQRIPAALIAAGAIVAGLAELGVLTRWLLAIASVLVVSGVILSMPPPSVQVHDLASGERIDVDLDQDSTDSAPQQLQNEDR